MKREMLCFAVAVSFAIPAWSATYNVPNAPTFLWLDICSNGIGVSADQVPQTHMEPDVFDIGIDFNADGTVDRWLSEETMAYLGGGNASTITPGAWRRFIIRLDDMVGTEAKVVIVDRSEDYYIAVNAVRLNHADGTVVNNAVANGYFEDALNGWTVVESSIPEADLIVENDGSYSMYSPSFFATGVSSADSANTAVIESDTFTIVEPSSFIYGAVSGGASEMFNLENAPTDNGSGVFIDLADSADELNGEYDEGIDIPLIGFYGGDQTTVRNQMHPVFFDTSGLEGKFAQVVAIDNSNIFHIGLDSFRMNWDNTTIVNGGFDQDIPTPDDTSADPAWWNEQNAIEYVEHPNGNAPSGDNPGTFPGWKVYALSDGLDSVWFFDKTVHGNMFSGRTYIGTGGFDDLGRLAVDIKVESDPFQIIPIPNPSENVFVQFSSAQGSSRERFSPDGQNVERGIVQLWVDVNGNGNFDDDDDYVYTGRNQNMGHNLNNSNMDVWQYPDLRLYIMEEHQGLQAIVYVEDTLGPTRGSYGWMCVDDFFMWNGSDTMLLFPNSDFEEGTLDNWTAEYDINGGALGTVGSGWLSGTFEAYFDGLVDHVSMNNRHTMVDGMFAADSAANEAGISGDAGTGSLTSIPFTLPTLDGTPIPNWQLYK